MADQVTTPDATPAAEPIKAVVADEKAKSGLAATEGPMKPFVAPTAPVVAVPKTEADPKSATTVTPGIPPKTDAAPAKA